MLRAELQAQLERYRRLELRLAELECCGKINAAQAPPWAQAPDRAQIACFFMTPLRVLVSCSCGRGAGPPAIRDPSSLGATQTSVHGIPDCLQYCERFGRGDVRRTDACPEIRAPSTRPSARRGLPGGRRSAPTTSAACCARRNCCEPVRTSPLAGSVPISCARSRTPPSVRWSACSRRSGCATRPTVSCAASPGTWTSSTSSAASPRCRTTRSGWRSTTSRRATNGRHRPRTSSPRSRSSTRSSVRRSRSFATPPPPRCPSSPSPR